MGSVIPKIKKKVSSYINNETGRISKQSLITIGAFMGTAAIATLATTTPTRATVTATLQPEEGNPITLIGSHSSHDSHSSACGEHSSGACGQDCGENGGCDPTCEASCQSSDMSCCNVQDMGHSSHTSACGGEGSGEPEPPCTTTCETSCTTNCERNCQLGCEKMCEPAEETGGGGGGGVLKVE